MPKGVGYGGGRKSSKMKTRPSKSRAKGSKKAKRKSLPVNRRK